jgi:uncharacterized protein YecE (DUF72 family)
MAWSLSTARRILAPPRADPLMPTVCDAPTVGGRTRVGISGWNYPGWRREFYPAGLPQRRELEYASQRLDSIEINGTFYALQRPESFCSWRDQTPEDFVFAVKGSRFITHMKRLADPETTLPNFFASGPLALGRKLGPVLWQLPPTLAYDPDRLEAFFDLLPRTTTTAARLAEEHDDRVEGRAWTTTDARRRIRHAVEVRHPSFRDPSFVDLLRRHRIGLVVADAAGDWPALEDVTADFVYLRLHGAEELYTSGYDAESLDAWAAKIRRWAAGEAPTSDRTVGTAGPRRDSGRDVFVYFDNDAKVRAPFDAMELAKRLAD